MSRRFSTCGRCGSTIAWRARGAAYAWRHVAETPRTADGHLPDPDDSWASGPDADDAQPEAAR